MKTKILFVCLGNICRSPLAEALFRKHVEEAGLMDNFEIDSCGTSNYHIGDPPDARSKENALQNGVNIVHRGRQMMSDDLTEYDLVLAMDKSNKTNIEYLSTGNSQEASVKLMREFDPNAQHQDVPDPYYGGINGFQEVFDMLNRSTKNLLHSLEQN